MAARSCSLEGRWTAKGSGDLVAGPVPPAGAGHRPCSASISLGRTLWTSPTMPRSAMEKIGRFLVLVDGDDVLGALHPHHVLRGAGDAGGDVDGRLHDLARLADLVAVGHPAGVDDGPGRARRALQQLGQVLDHLVVAGLAQAPAARDHDRGLVELGPGRLLDVHGVDGRRPGRRRGRAPAQLDDLGRPPPDSSAANDFGRKEARCGPSPVNVVVTSVLPPKIGVVTATESPVDRDVRRCW